MKFCKHNFLKFAVSMIFLGTVCLIGATLHLHKEITNIKTEDIHDSGSREKRSAQQQSSSNYVVDPEQTKSSSSVNNTNAGNEASEINGGAIFTRWGRSCCPNGNSELVYEGIVGGSQHNQQGGGSNYLCLPRNPQWNKYTDATEGYQAYIYGTEFETGSNELLEKTNAGNSKLQDHDAKCAVCRSKRRNSQVMIPARRECPSGWSMEYEGYLMTAHFNHPAQHEFICVDKAPEVDEKGYKDDNGALLYHVQGQCGSLPCPDYVNGRELTCVVCTK